MLNKIKQHPFDVNRRALQQKYPFIRDFIRTDCEANIGIEELRNVIERETDCLDHLRDAFPTSWFKIKDRLARTRKNYLTLEEYRKECERMGEKDSTFQERLAGYLHSLGIALNYKDDARLRDKHVLNPRWVTEGIYKIINSEELEKQKGEIKLDELGKILDTKKYPESMHRFLLDLMKKFELCFSFPDDDTHYLIPDLLDKQEPEEASEFKPEESLNFQYHYPVLPEGLLPHFIVRTHVLSQGEKSKRWRTGVILEFEGCRALVKADIQEKKVYISVSGRDAGSRRRLLTVIRFDFDRIHHNIRNLNPAEMVPFPGYPDVVVPYEELVTMELSGEKEIKRTLSGHVINFSIDDLLNGVDIEQAKSREAGSDSKSRPIRLFCSYSHKDESLKNQLETHLKLLQRQGLIDTWHDRKIQPGDDWEKQIDENINRADVVLLLVSSDFINSDYCYQNEMQRALERHYSGEAQVIPIIIRDVNWNKAPFAQFQALPKNGRAVTTWRNRDTAWRNVSEGIESIVEGLLKKPTPNSARA